METSKSGPGLLPVAAKSDCKTESKPTVQFVELITSNGYRVTLTEADMVGSEADKKDTFAIFLKHSCVSCSKVLMNATKFSKCHHSACLSCLREHCTSNNGEVTCPSGCEPTYSDFKQALESWDHASLDILWESEIYCSICKKVETDPGKLKPCNPRKIGFHLKYGHRMQANPLSEETLKFHSGCYVDAIKTGPDSESAAARSQPGSSYCIPTLGALAGSIFLGNKMERVNICGGHGEEPDRHSRSKGRDKAGGCSRPSRSRYRSPSRSYFSQDSFFSQKDFNRDFSRGFFSGNTSGNASKKAFTGDFFGENSQEKSADRKEAPAGGVEINVTSRTAHGKTNVTTKASVRDPDNTMGITVNEGGTVVITSRKV